jgi:hypothetical protein
LEPFPQPPAILKQLLTDSNPQSRSFREKIRQYNAAFAFTSVAVQLDMNILHGAGPCSFHMHGDLHHNMGALIPQNDAQPAYAQLYIYDPQAALAARQARNPTLNHTIMSDLQMMLNSVNPFVELYKQAYQIMIEKPPEEHGNIQARIVLQQDTDRRQYNLPTVEDVAAIIPGNGEEDVDHCREIILRLKAPDQSGSSLRRISHLNPLYSPLHYVLLFPHGEQGWHVDIPSLPGPQGQIRSQHVTQ